MATATDNEIPVIFNEIIKKRITNYIEEELKEHIKKKVHDVAQDVLSDLQIDTQQFQDLLRNEMLIVVKAIYNGKELAKKPQPTEGA